MTQANVLSRDYRGSAILPPPWTTQPHSEWPVFTGGGGIALFGVAHTVALPVGANTMTFYETVLAAERWSRAFEAARFLATFQFGWAVDEIAWRAASQPGAYVVVANVTDVAAAPSDAAQYFEIMPEEWVNDYAARHRARAAESATRQREYMDADIPLIFEGADW